jgi:hypothetical protein
MAHMGSLSKSFESCMTSYWGPFFNIIIHYCTHRRTLLINKVVIASTRLDSTRNGVCYDQHCVSTAFVAIYYGAWHCLWWWQVRGNLSDWVSPFIICPSFYFRLSHGFEHTVWHWLGIVHHATTAVGLLLLVPVSSAADALRLVVNSASHVFLLLKQFFSFDFIFDALTF